MCHASIDSRLFMFAPAGRHFCQIHQDSASLDAALAEYVLAGMWRDDAVVVIASPRRNDLLREQLTSAGLDLEQLQASDRIALLDSAEVLEQLRESGVLDWSRFRERIGAVLAGMRPNGRGTIRAYGEMVNDLWQAGQRQEAIALEEFWNRLAQEHHFCLFCGYEIDGLDADGYDSLLGEIGRVHTDILATEDDERLLRALDQATQEVLHVPLSALISSAGAEGERGDHRLPAARRTILWLQRKMPASLPIIMARTRICFTSSQENAGKRTSIAAD